ncbi:putative cell wall integrity and stress response component 2-like [Scophthalmus maximus]|uniref:Putative cell wall integrity and stress response component 2-like n=1 Tax=Scophthalmus maximus TaxID=52904 RepID=A0A2U9BAT3_SCOMX|nr:putative cell wall integrity and stress response component 2-like [Scophthalmus maximus]
MKTTRVLLVLLLASAHVSTAVSSDQPDNTGNKTQEQGTAQTTAETTTVSRAGSNMTGGQKQEVTSEPAAKTTTGQPWSPARTTVKPTSPPASTPDHKDVTTASPAVPQTDEKALRNDTWKPRSPHTPSPSNHSETPLEPGTLEGETSHTPDSSSHSETEITQTPLERDDNRTKETKPDKGTSTQAPVIPQLKKEKAKEKGSQTGGEENEPHKSDKRLWWILLPVLLVGAAAAIVLKFKSKKLNDHTETIDTGTENASFQSRPESTKDGVMLLGVKSSGGEESVSVARNENKLREEIIYEKPSKESPPELLFKVAPLRPQGSAPAPRHRHHGCHKHVEDQKRRTYFGFARPTTRPSLH